MKQTLVLLVLCTAFDARALKRITPAVFPPHATETEGTELGYGIADRAGATLYATGAYSHLHLKQLLSVARNHGFSGADMAEPVAASTATNVLGAPVGAYGALRRTASGWVLRMTVFDARAGTSEELVVDLSGDAAVAVRNGGTAVARAIAALDDIEIPSDGIHPQTESGAAMGAYLACYAVLVRQPMGLRKSHVVDAATVAAARAACEEAVGADPGFLAAWSALSLASSLSLENERAGAALEKLRGVTAYVPFAVLAEYWLATRFNSNAAGAVVLRDAARNHRGALIFLTYLGEHLNITKKYNEALGVWRQYLRLVERSPYALSQKGYAMARLGFIDDAIAVSREAVAQDPDSFAARLELASRLVDKGELAEAAELLEPMARDRRAWGEIVLRLGYVYLLQGKKRPAQELFHRSLELAQAPSEWRTRGRARYNLASVEAGAGELESAEGHLLAAADEGFVVQSLLRLDPNLKKLAGRERVAHLFEDPELQLDSRLLQTSPFPTDAGGTARPIDRPAAPGFSF